MAQQPSPPMATVPPAEHARDRKSQSADGHDDVPTEVAELWRTALSSGHHGAGCSCCGAQPVMLNGADLEADIVHYLRGLYGRESRSDLLALLDRRSSSPSQTFAAWLRILAGEGDDDAVDRLLSDVCHVLRGFGGPPGMRTAR